jgi:hypothetical protein
VIAVLAGGWLLLLAAGAFWGKLPQFGNVLVNFVWFSVF